MHNCFGIRRLIEYINCSAKSYGICSTELSAYIQNLAEQCFSFFAASSFKNNIFFSMRMAADGSAVSHTLCSVHTATDHS